MPLTPVRLYAFSTSEGLSPSRCASACGSYLGRKRIDRCLRDQYLSQDFTCAIAAAGVGLSHKSQPAAVNLVQATDLGAVYSLDEVAAISQVARAHGLKVHMDGARFANAVAQLGCTPAQATWKAGKP